MKRITWLVLPLVGLLACAGEPEPPDTTRSVVLMSDPYEVDQIYRSMMGPKGVLHFAFSRQGDPKLLWITGFEAEIVNASDGSAVSPEFMCHSNLDYADKKAHSTLFRGENSKTSHRLFTLSQGQMKVDFPPGFGIPVLSSEAFTLLTQVLNLNPQNEIFEVRHKTTIRFVRDGEATLPMKPLYQVPLQSLVLLEGTDGFPGLKEGRVGHGTSCSIGEPVRDPFIEDGFGRKFSGHWVVEPGRHVYHTPVTQMMNLPSDTTVHHIAVHLHPFAESLELRDLTTGEIIFKSNARNRSNQIGLEHVDSITSEDGIRIRKDHFYELVAVYNNTSEENQDSMAVMILYALDPIFQRPDLTQQSS